MHQKAAWVGFLVLAAWVGAAMSAAGKDTATSAPASEWLTSVPQAVEAAKKSSRPILADFTGSDWCGWCMKLKAEVFDTQEFKDWAAQHVVLLELDFPKRKAQDEGTRKQNVAMARKHNVDGFPTIVFLKPDGNSIGTMGYEEGGPRVWIAQAQKILDKAK